MNFGLQEMHSPKVVSFLDGREAAASKSLKRRWKRDRTAEKPLKKRKVELPFPTAPNAS